MDKNPSLLTQDFGLTYLYHVFDLPAAFSDPQLLLSDANTVYKTSLDGFSTEVTLNHPESLSPVKGKFVFVLRLSHQVYLCWKIAK